MPPAPSTAEAPAASEEQTDAIWSSILKEASSSKMVLQKNVLILGDPNSGKTNLIQHLRRDHREMLNQNPAGASGATVTSAATNTLSTQDEKIESNELALSYAYADIKDEDNEETLARLGIYQLASSHPGLMPYALNATSFPDTTILIVLDWQRPWRFVESLQRWFKVIEDGVANVRAEGREGSGNWSKGGVVVDEGMERLGKYLQDYQEPPADGTAPPAPTPLAGDVVIPLPDGCLTVNTGIPIVVVCCKADMVNLLEKEQDYKEEQFDYIQQTLRTMCLKYGASLFYVSTHRPRSFALLRAYILHRLLGSGSAASQDSANSTSSPERVGGKPVHLQYPFLFRPQVVDRDILSVPSGWDTWGKIQLLRDGFDCRHCLERWDNDNDKIPEEGLRKEYETLIRDASVGVKPIDKTKEVAPEDEQAFLGRLVDTLKGTGGGERIAPTNTSTLATTAATAGAATAGGGVGAVGKDPGAAATEEDEDIASKIKKLAEQAKVNRALNPSRPIEAGATEGVDNAAAAAAAAAGVGGQSQNQVLASFFDSLRTKKPAGRATGNPNAARKIVSDELDKMRRESNK